MGLGLESAPGSLSIHYSRLIIIKYLPVIIKILTVHNKILTFLNMYGPFIIKFRPFVTFLGRHDKISNFYNKFGPLIITFRLLAKMAFHIMDHWKEYYCEEENDLFFLKIMLLLNSHFWKGPWYL